MANDDYLSMAVREFRRLKNLADKAIAQMPAECFFGRPGEGDNSVAVIVKYVAGNLCSRWRDFLTSDGEKPDRHRDKEFVVAETDTRERLLARWEEGWAALFDALKPLGPADLGRPVLIRRETLTVMDAVHRQLTQYAYHVGQIVYLAKHFTGGRWTSLSIPLRKSEEFNRAPERYLGKP
ncbi:MAG TPA: DUF1572 family protein [Opitutaceae bacterium]|jgi:hypothetical protein